MPFVENGVVTMRVVDLPRLPENQGRIPESKDSTTTTNQGPATTKVIISLPAGETKPTAVLGRGTIDV